MVTGESNMGATSAAISADAPNHNPSDGLNDWRARQFQAEHRQRQQLQPPNQQQHHQLMQQQPQQLWQPQPGQSSRSTSKTTTTTVYSATSKSAGANETAKMAGESGGLALVEDLGKQAALDSSARVRLNLSRQSDRKPTSSELNHYSSARARQQQQQSQPQQQPPVNASRQTYARGEENAEGSQQVTTISTIAAQSGQSRIVLALLRDGESISLKVQEMRPAIFDVGANQNECVKYREEQQRLMRNLHKQRQTPMDGWMKKYDKVKASEPSMSTQRRLVYMCMVENLQASWRALLNQLDRRSELLDEALKFYESAERLIQALDRADNHVQLFRQEFLAGPNSLRFNQACNELRALNKQVLEQYQLAKRNQQRLVELVSAIASENLGDVRVNHLIADAQSLINYINAYIEPLERRKIQLESVLTMTTNTSETTSIISSSSRKTNSQNLNGSGILSNRFIQDDQLDQANRLSGAASASSGGGGGGATSTTTTTANTSITTTIREISSFNDLNLVENWLNVKIEQLNSSLLSSLGVSVPDSRSILAKHEQIGLECRAIEEATLTFNGRNIHAIKTVEPKSDKIQGDKSLFEQQKVLAERTRDVITILDSRIVLLRRTIDFYLKSKDATSDIGKMMRRLQVDNSLQSVQFVANELELKDVSSVVASGATIISELQQLQLAQQHGQRSRIVNLNLVTSGIRAIIDQLNQDLAHLKTVLNQRRLVLLNEDASKMANNFANKCHQLHFWLENHVKSYLLANKRVGTDATQARDYIDGHEQLRLALQNKTLEVEALLRSLPTLTEHFDAKSRTADEIQQATDELRADWITVTNCLDRRLELARKYLAILQTVSSLSRELNELDRMRNGKLEAPERTEEDVRANVEQAHLQLTNQVKNFNQDVARSSTELLYQAPAGSSTKQPIVSDINKQQLDDHANGMLRRFTEQKRQVIDIRGQSSLKRQPTTAAHERPQQIDPPRFTRLLADLTVEPFSSVELECETVDANCQVDWFMNNFKKIPSTIRHSAVSENNVHRLTISNFSPVCCGIYQVRATNSAGQALSQCRLRLAGISESEDANEELTAPTKQQQQPSNKVGNSNERNTQTQTNKITSITENRTISRVIQGVDSPGRDSESPMQPPGDKHKQILPKQQQQQRQTSVTITQLTSDSDTDIGAQSTQTTFDGSSQSRKRPAQTQHRPLADRNHLRPSGVYVDSPVSSATLSRSVSKSPFEGTPQPPSFVQPLTDSMANCCSRAGLVCVVVGNPAPTIEWMHNNQTIATSKCPKSPACMQNGNLCKLTIETKNPNTQGQYVCRASNRIGQTSTGFMLAK